MPEEQSSLPGLDTGFDTNRRWVETFSVADEMAIAALPADTRAVVERYVKHSIDESTIVEDEDNESFEEGWDAAVAMMKEQAKAAIDELAPEHKKAG